MLLYDIDIYMVVDCDLLLDLSVYNWLAEESNEHELFVIWLGYHVICYVVLVAHVV